jgi:branched-chain amino acid transport system ATP-binding protein
VSLLETDGLTKAFGSLVAVDHVDLAVDAGTVHSVIGPNGAGKSTLFNCITGLHKPTDGTVSFEEQDITGLAPYRIVRRGIARSFQNSDVFGGLSVAENVRIAAQAADEGRDSMLRLSRDLTDVTERATTALADVGLAADADRQASELSHGDRRKLEIALTVVNDPKLLLLDEPAAGMGKQDGLETFETIQRLAADRDITIVMIEHDIEIVMDISDTITVLQNGAVIAEGTPDEIATDERVQRAYLGVDR